MIDALMESLPLGVAIIDTDGEVIRGNPAFYEIMGGKSYESINLLECQGMRAVGASGIIRDAFNNGENQEFELVTISPWDKEISARMTLVPQADLMICIIEDLTETKQKEKIIRESQKELQEKIEKLKELDRFKNDILSNVSHELKTPITIMRAGLEMAMYEDDPDSLKELLQNTSNGLDRMDNIVSVMIYGAQMQHRKIEKEFIDLVGVIKNIFMKIDPMAKKMDIKIKTLFPKTVPPIMADWKALDHALSNLINNAVKFNHPDGDVLIEIKDSSESVEIIVSERGIGIDKEDMEHIFEPLHQIDATTTRRYSGVGLGLANVKNIIEAHGGKVWVRSEPGEGSSFHVFLPREVE